MLKLGRVTKVRMLFLVLVFVFNFDLIKFSAAILEKGLFFGQVTNCRVSICVLQLQRTLNIKHTVFDYAYGL